MMARQRIEPWSEGAPPNDESARSVAVRGAALRTLSVT